MKYIVKTVPPECLTDWINQQQAGGLETNYKVFPNTRELKAYLLIEQYGLCAYTGQTVDLGKSSIEHLKPRTICIVERDAIGATLGEDLSYTNMVAVWKVKLDDDTTGTKKERHKDLFGEAVRGSEYDPGLFLSPLNPACEHSFSFDIQGAISPRNASAAYMIDMLKLDHGILTGLRRAAIDQVFLLIQDGLQIEDVITIYSQPLDGILPSFCFVISQVFSSLQ